MTRINFQRVPTSTAVSHLGALIFDKRDELGANAFLDLSDESSCPLLARDLIACLYEYVKPHRIATDLSISGYVTGIKEILDHCKRRNFSSSTRISDLTSEVLLDYRADLKVKLADGKTSRLRRRYGSLTRLIQTATTIGLAPEAFVPPRNYAHVNDEDVTQPYSAGELVDLQDACRIHINSLAPRFAYGSELLALGVDPRGRSKLTEPSGRFSKIAPGDRKWNQLPNLLWYAVNVLDGEYLNRDQLYKRGHSSFCFSLTGGYGGPFRKRDVYELLYTTAEDLIPFALLLAKTTGRNEWSILYLKRDCLENVDGKYYLRFRKDRGRDRLFRRPIPNDGLYSPVALIKMLLKLTEPLVRFAAPKDRDLLFLGFTIKGHGSLPVKRLDASYLKSQMNRKDGWCQQRNLKADSGDFLRASMRRLRVNYLTEKYKRTGQLSKVSRDAKHALSRTTVSYVDNDATKHIHEEAVERGIQAALALSKPTVVSDKHEAQLSEIVGDASLAARIMSGEQDVFFASCRDFFNRPGGPADTPCDKAWGCLFCSNAVITTHVLPRLVLFRDFVAAQKVLLPEGDWNLRFASAERVMNEDVFPNFSAQALAQAEQHAADEVLYLPLELRGS